jgi:hypothetical protein
MLPLYQRLALGAANSSSQKTVTACVAELIVRREHHYDFHYFSPFRKFLFWISRRHNDAGFV